MAHLLLMDDEPLSLHRLSKVLCNDGQHELSTADSLSESQRIVQLLGNNLDLLIIDVSMFESLAPDLPDLFADACPKAKMLVITPRVNHPAGGHRQLRIPFDDRDFLNAVNEVLGMRQGVAAGIGAPAGGPQSRRNGSRVLKAREAHA